MGDSNAGKAPATIVVESGDKQPDLATRDNST
jgi:hypothetical protein